MGRGRGRRRPPRARCGGARLADARRALPSRRSASRRALDGALFYALLPWRIARELRDFRPDAALVQGVHETVAFLIARRVAGSRTKVILDVQGDWHEATRLYGSPLRRLLNPLNDALAPVAVRSRRRGAHGLDADDRPRHGARRRARGGLPVLRRRRRVSRAAARAAAGAAARGLRRRARAVQGVRHARRGVAARRAARARRDAAHRRRRNDARPGRATRRGAAAADGVVAAPDRRRRSRRRWTRRGSSACRRAPKGLPRVALEAACRGRAIVGGNRAGIPDVVHDGENGLLVDPDDADGLADALVADPLRPGRGRAARCARRGARARSGA